MDFIQVAALCALEMRRKKKSKRRFWLHPLTAQRSVKGQFHKLYGDLRGHPAKFFNYYRMSLKSFDELLDLIRPSITRQDTRWRRSVTPEERLSVTLRYLSTGNSFHSLHYEFLMGVSTMRQIVMETCKAICKDLKVICFPEKTEEMWRQVAEKFAAKTQFPHCLGAVDGKHIRMKKPNNTCSQFFNYKQYCSIVLMAVVDADYCFITVDIGAYGSSSDPTVFGNSKFGKKLSQGVLNIPPDEPLPGDESGTLVPYVFVGDEAFTLSKHMLRPFGKNKLTVAKRIYNYRHTRARRMVECAFGILASKWRIFLRPIDVKPSFCDKIVQACCTLHNFVRKRDGVAYEDTLYECPLGNNNPNNLRGEREGTWSRDYFVNYFTSPEGSLPWQYDKI